MGKKQDRLYSDAAFWILAGEHYEKRTGHFMKKEITIDNGNRKVSVTYYTPHHVDQYPVVLISHGYNGHQTDFEKTGEYYSKTGIACAALTFCGGSTRDVSGYASTDMSLLTEKEDLLALFEYVNTDPKVKKDQIFLFGASQGGLVSALTAAELTNKIAGLILLYPAFMIADNWRERFPDINDIPEEEELWGLTLGKKFFMDMRDLQVYDIIGAYEGPVLVLQGSDDEIAKTGIVKQGAKCYKNCKLEMFTGEPHGFSEDGNRRMEAMMLYFIHEIIGR